jgi:hypothetical protein
VREKAAREGYVPPGAPSGEGLLYDLGAWLLDPMGDADKAVPTEARFNIAPWRKKIRDAANAKSPGQTIDFTWEIARCTTDVWGRPEVDNRKVVYRKQPDGRWTVDSGNASGTPDFNQVISRDVPDETVRSQMIFDPCSA